jgi:hypothetical protein
LSWLYVCCHGNLNLIKINLLKAPRSKTSRTAAHSSCLLWINHSSIIMMVLHFRLPFQPKDLLQHTCCNPVHHPTNITLVQRPHLPVHYFFFSVVRNYGPERKFSTVMVLQKSYYSWWVGGIYYIWCYVIV